ncbi:MAG TPA: macro domain-containing protein [Anaerolineae bacterium]|nr:macro domain-containing protein [Anaerolineae bacterium]
MSRITLHKGDLTRVSADAIVNAANNALWMGGGVAGALKRAGGKEIEEEAVKQGPIPVGEAVVTGAGGLKARYVIHAAVMATDMVTDADKIRTATQNSLLRAEELGLKSVAFPALGTGVGGFPYSRAAEVMIDAVNEHLAGDSCLEEVLFVLYGDEAFEAFEKHLGGLSSPAERAI